jgi:hypothetical protein
MKPGKLTAAILSLLLASVAFAGCAKYATTGEMISRIEKRTYMGISEQEFKERIPIARLVDVSYNKKLYVFVVGEPCFVCGTEQAFLRSSEVYATKFIFEDGTLVEKERIAGGI